MLTHDRLVERLDYNPATGIFTWVHSRKQAGTPMDEYIIIGIDGERYLAHRVAWLFMTGNWPTDEIDHVDLVKSNNAFSNLREATRSENQRNTRVYSNNKMRLKGVSANFRGNSFRAQISINGRTKRLGSFPTPEQAHAVYLAAAKDLAGDFARPE